MGYSENAIIQSYDFSVTNNNDETTNITISKKGGHVINMNTNRNVSTEVITQEEAKKILNKELEIISEGMAIIPTEWKTEILCYEFKGKVEDREFLVYINAENGREEDILVINNTPNGTLTM